MGALITYKHSIGNKTGVLPKNEVEKKTSKNKHIAYPN